MRNTVKNLAAAAAIGWMCWGAETACLAQTTEANLSPDLQQVIQLSKQKMSDDIITSYIKNTGHAYKLSADDIIYLNSQGVSQAVIAALLASSPGGATAATPAAQTPPPESTAPPAAPADAGSSPQPPPLDAGSSPAPSGPDSSAPPAQPLPTPGGPPPMQMPPPAPAGLQDNFFADGGLNPTLWQTQSGLLSGIASMSGRPVWTSLAFSPAGLQMSGVHGPAQFMGIQSLASYSPPFNFTANVTGQTQSGVPFEVYLVSADLSQWVSVAGHLGGRGERHGAVDVGGGFGHVFGGVRIPLGESRSPEYGLWVNHTGSGFPMASLGYKVFEDMLAGVPYTIQISVGADGSAAVSVLAAGALIASQNVLVGTGPFYVVLAGRDGEAMATWQSAQLISTAPVAAAAPPPPATPTLDYFQPQLAPYGTWINSPQYGLCWQPAVSPAWRPYVDGGSWTYTDAGWYWQSDYPWGDITFHYGRWAYSPTGWVWVPGYEYAPAWVVWRHDDVDGVVGWAPLPPGALFVDGGWRWHGARVGVDFDFGLGVGFFCFVDGGHFWGRDFRHYAVPRDRLAFVFGHSHFDNHYHYDHGRFYNDGIDRDRMARLTHRDVHEIEVHHMDEVRHQEEMHNVAVRHEDVHDFHPGERPDARGFAHPDNHAPVPPAHMPAPPAHAPAPGSHGGSPQSSGGGHQGNSQGNGNDQRDQHPH